MPVPPPPFQRIEEEKTEMLKHYNDGDNMMERNKKSILKV